MKIDFKTTLSKSRGHAEMAVSTGKITINPAILGSLLHLANSGPEILTPTASDSQVRCHSATRPAPTPRHFPSMDSSFEF